MFARFFILTALFITAYPAFAQGIMGDVFSGKLIDPEVGVYAWYDLTDTSTGKQFYLRLAIVGEEKVKGKTGHWFEVELLPRVGFPAVYKLLLTGPASDPKNVHRILMKERTNPQVELDSSALSGGNAGSENARRKVVGEDEVATQIGTVIAEHVVVEEGDTTTDVWLNDEVRPMGLVKIKNAQGELVLRNYGKGGQHASSAMDRKFTPGAQADEPVNEAPKVTVETVVVEDETTPEEADMEEVDTQEAQPETAETGEEPQPESGTSNPNVLQDNNSGTETEEEMEAEEEEADRNTRSGNRRPYRGFGARPR